jgi:hypothetical protein
VRFVQRQGEEACVPACEKECHVGPQAPACGAPRRALQGVEIPLLLLQHAGVCGWDLLNGCRQPGGSAALGSFGTALVQQLQNGVTPGKLPLGKALRLACRIDLAKPQE